MAQTVRGKIFNTDVYEDEPEIVLLGMFTSLVSASIIMMGATYLALPVSTTHTVCAKWIILLFMSDMMWSLTFIHMSFHNISRSLDASLVSVLLPSKTT